MILAVLVVLVAAAGIVQAQGRQSQWVVLGTRTVTDKADHDTITVTAAKGTFTAIKLQVRQRPVDFHRVVIHFANGADQKVELRNTIRAGGELSRHRHRRRQSGDPIDRLLVRRQDAGPRDALRSALWDGSSKNANTRSAGQRTSGST